MNYNRLKIQKNILRILEGLFIISLVFSDAVFADKTKKRASGKSRSSKGKSSRSAKGKSFGGRGSVVKKSTDVKSVSEEAKTENATATKNANKTESKKDTSGINRYNCENSYFKCMNQFCFNPQNGRCGCKDEKKFATSNEQCAYILGVCPSKSNDILDNYKKGSVADCNSYVIKTEGEKNVSASNALAKLVSCMRTKCKANRQYEFLACFDPDNFEKGMKKCEKTYQDVQDKQLVKDLFKESMVTYKQKYCDDINGTIQSDGECHLQIGFGPSYKDIKAVKDFKVGDKVVCSESGFGTDLGESKVQKLRAIKEIALFGIDVLKTGVKVASMFVGNAANKEALEAQAKEASDAAQKFTDQANATNQQGQGLSDSSKQYLQKQADALNNKAAALTETAEAQKVGIAATSMESINGLLGTQHLAGAVGGVMTLKMMDFSYNGYCFVIKGDVRKQLFEASDDFYYQIRWTPQWSELMLSDEDEVEVE